jgi:DNA-binding PadR family transcriptional regulator
MYSKELIKGTLTVIILKLLEDNGKMYGYQISQKVKELSEEKILIKEGSLYPALHKLKDEGLIEVETVNIGKRIRRYYYLTEKGLKVKDDKVSETKDFMNTLHKILSFNINPKLKWNI